MRWSIGETLRLQREADTLLVVAEGSSRDEASQPGSSSSTSLPPARSWFSEQDRERLRILRGARTDEAVRATDPDSIAEGLRQAALGQSTRPDPEAMAPRSSSEPPGRHVAPRLIKGVHPWLGRLGSSMHRPDVSRPLRTGSCAAKRELRLNIDVRHFFAAGPLGYRFRHRSGRRLTARCQYVWRGAPLSCAGLHMPIVVFHFDFIQTLLSVRRLSVRFDQFAFLKHLGKTVPGHPPGLQRASRRRSVPVGGRLLRRRSIPAASSSSSAITTLARSSTLTQLCVE